MAREGEHGHAVRSLQLLLEAYVGESLPEWPVFEAGLRLVHLAPNDILFRAGEVHPYLYLVHTGLLRAQSTTPTGHTSTLFFSEDGDVLASMTALSPRAAHRVYNRGLHPRERDLRTAVEGRAVHTVSAIERSTLVRADYRVFEQLARQNATWARMAASLTMIYTMTLQADAIWTRDSPEERYRDLLQDRPNLVSRLTQRDLASFLNVTEVTMSRIAKRVRADQTFAAEDKPADVLV
ncbi:MAG: Crp/Fnr family transcriptional regulator [Propionicimonas sp.]|nr:Crp/Fnr family transcriptional regulator [Propionicimonas sp.]